jgi:hypothetical protein
LHYCPFAGPSHDSGLFSGDPRPSRIVATIASPPASTSSSAAGQAGSDWAGQTTLWQLLCRQGPVRLARSVRQGFSGHKRRCAHTTCTAGTESFNPCALLELTLSKQSKPRALCTRNAESTVDLSPCLTCRISVNDRGFCVGKTRSVPRQVQTLPASRGKSLRCAGSWARPRGSRQLPVRAQTHELLKRKLDQYGVVRRVKPGDQRLEIMFRHCCAAGGD